MKSTITTPSGTFIYLIADFSFTPSSIGDFFFQT